MACGPEGFVVLEACKQAGALGGGYLRAAGPGLEEEQEVVVHKVFALFRHSRRSWLAR